MDRLPASPPATGRPEFRWFPILPAGYAKIRQYTATYRLSQPVAIDKVSIDFLLPEGRFVVLEIDLQTTDTQGRLVEAAADAEPGLPVCENPTAGWPVYLAQNIVLYDRVEEMIDTIETLNPISPCPLSSRGEISWTVRPCLPNRRMARSWLMRVNSDRFSCASGRPSTRFSWCRKRIRPTGTPRWMARR